MQAYTSRAAVLVAATAFALGCGELPPTVAPDGAASLATGKPPGDPPLVITFRGNPGDLSDRITSDGRGSYADGACGVQATFNLTDARLVPDASKIRPQDVTACGGRQARKVMASFTQRVDGSPPAIQDGNTVGAHFFKVDEVELVTTDSGTVLRTAIAITEGVCAHGLRFNPSLDSQSNSVAVKKNTDGTWTVATQAFPNDVAVCIPDEDSPNPPMRSYYHMPFQIAVRFK